MRPSCCSSMNVLNLAVVNACNLVLVKNQFVTISKVFRFFDNDPKRQYVLNGVCDDSFKLKSLCKTRWLQRLLMAPHICGVFDSLVKEFNEETTIPRSGGGILLSMQCH